MGKRQADVAASIDIGTHSVLLLVAKKTSKGEIESISDKIEITRLGEGLQSSGKISAEAEERTIRAIKKHLDVCNHFGAEKVKAVGTAALRKAKNARDFISRAKRELALDVEVISGEKEARLTYEASALDFGKSITVLDIGGGSTEFIFGPPPLNLKSVQAGCVTLTERFFKSDPPLSRQISSLRSHLRTLFSANVDTTETPSTNEVIATAGTATSIMAMIFELEPYDGRMVHGQKLSIEALEELIKSMQKKSIAELKKIKGLMPERAHVILCGAVILHEAMRHLECKEVTISDRGVRWGVVYETLGIV